MSKCWGLTLAPGRCRNPRPPGLWPFCHQHRWRTPLSVLSFVAAVAASNPVWHFLEPLLFPCVLSATVTTDIVSRLHGRAPLEAQGEMPFQTQELFYEWRVALKTSRPTDNVGVTIERLSAGDRLAVQPAGSQVSALVPRWMSGFDEPTRTPDSYSRSVRFDHIDRKEAAQVVVRRLLGSGTLASDLIRLGDVVASCTVQKQEAGPDDDAKRLRARAEGLPAAIHVSGVEGRLPLGGDLGDPATDEQQVSVEARCMTDACEQYEVNKLEARVGTSPAEEAMRHLYSQCQDMADAMRDVVGCVEGPTCSTSPDQPCQFSMCPGVVLDQERSAILLAVLRERGVQLNMVSAPPE
jgi:hypothetical protein